MSFDAALDAGATSPGVVNAAMLSEQRIGCPYCGESITVLVDEGDAGDPYVEDCQVCCRPITLCVILDADGGFVVSAHDENDVF